MPSIGEDNNSTFFDLETYTPQGSSQSLRVYGPADLLSVQGRRNLFIADPELRIMAASTVDALSDRLPTPVWWFLGVPLRTQTYRNLLYLLLAFPLGILYFVLITVGISVGIAMLILVVGVFLLITFFGFFFLIANAERIFTNIVLGTAIQGRERKRDGLLREQAKDIVFDRKTWTSIIYLPVKFVFGLVGFITIFVGFSTAIAMLMVPLYYDQPGVYVGVITERAPEIHQTIYLGWNYLLVGVDAAFTLGYWQVDSLGAALVVAFAGLGGILVTFHLCNALTAVWVKYAYWSMDGSIDFFNLTTGNPDERA